MSFKVIPLTEKHVAGFRAAVDAVARERRYLAMVRAFPLKETQAFVRANVRRRHPAFVALAGSRVVGWCDVQPVPRHTMAHSGVLGMGIIEGFRSQGIGSALYKKLGFVNEGRKRDAVKVDGRYYDLWTMAALFKRSKAS